jgi:hypothetical protein
MQGHEPFNGIITGYIRLNENYKEQIKNESEKFWMSNTM